MARPGLVILRLIKAFNYAKELFQQVGMGGLTLLQSLNPDGRGPNIHWRDTLGFKNCSAKAFCETQQWPPRLQPDQSVAEPSQNSIRSQSRPLRQ
jgi:hypothetical protein